MKGGISLLNTLILPSVKEKRTSLSQRKRNRKRQIKREIDKERERGRQTDRPGLREIKQ